MTQAPRKSRPVPGWLKDWDRSFPDEAYGLSVTKFCVLSNYYAIAQHTGAWPTMRQVSEASEVVLHHVHALYHELVAAGYLPRMTKAGPELEEMPWRLKEGAVAHEDLSVAPEEPEASQELEEAQRIDERNKPRPEPRKFYKPALMALETGPTSSGVTKTFVAPSLDFDVFG
jgi:hypothetical protein